MFFEGLIHKGDSDVVLWAVKDCVFRAFWVEFLFPGCGKIDRGSQGEHGIGAEFHILRLLLQQPPGVLVQPGAQLQIHFFRAQIATVGRGVIVVCQQLGGFLLENIGVIQPQRVAQQQRSLPICAVMGVPDMTCLLSQLLNGIYTEQV